MQRRVARQDIIPARSNLLETRSPLSGGMGRAPIIPPNVVRRDQRFIRLFSTCSPFWHSRRRIAPNPLLLRFTQDLYRIDVHVDVARVWKGRGIGRGPAVVKPRSKPTFHADEAARFDAPQLLFSEESAFLPVAKARDVILVQILWMNLQNALQSVRLIPGCGVASRRGIRAPQRRTRRAEHQEKCGKDSPGHKLSG